MTLSELQKKYWSALTEIYNEREAKSITRIVFEEVVGPAGIKFSSKEQVDLSPAEFQRLSKILERLLRHEPIQYILSEADFFGLKFKVNQDVLIPRPETEELVYIMAEVLRNNAGSFPEKMNFRILDIGTGTGCIPISLSKKFPDVIAEGCDISEPALLIAEENNRKIQTNVRFFKQDIMKTDRLERVYDIIVSNPPYISRSEKHALPANVLNYEPHLALFPDGNDDLIFYRKIASLAFQSLAPNGKLFFEINETRAADIFELLKKEGFNSLELRKDMQGKDRIVIAKKG